MKILFLSTAVAAQMFIQSANEQRWLGKRDAERHDEMQREAVMVVHDESHFSTFFLAAVPAALVLLLLLLGCWWFARR
jgi:hypothetical protein